jgi:hypothetical protein
MKFVSLGRLKKALEVTPDFHPFFGVTLLSMLKSGVNTATPKKWGSTEENTVLNEYFAPPGAPPKKPYFVPFGSRTESGFWRNDKYSAGALQSARTREDFANALAHPSREKWAFAPDFVQQLEALLPKQNSQPRRIPVLDVSAWLYRDQALPEDLSAVVAKFRGDFGLGDDAVFNALFDGSATEPIDQFFGEEKIDEDELRLLTGGIPRGPALGGKSEADLIAEVEQFLESMARLTLPPRFVRNFYFSLKAQRFVILAGRPGTGKSAFATAYAEALKKVFGGAVTAVIVPIGQEQGESETIGYAKIAGGLEPTELTRELFLSDRRRDVFIIILDEMNLSQADYYLARLLPAIESDVPVELPGIEDRYELPPDSYFVGTINSFVEESTRTPLSGPVKRRANVIEMPNVLDAVVADADPAKFPAFCRSLIEQTLSRYKARATTGTPSVFDGFRIAALEQSLAAGSHVLATGPIELLRGVVKACAVDRLTSLSAGVLQDVLDFVAMAAGEDVFRAIDQQIVQKVVPQLNGPVGAAKAVLEFLAAQQDGANRFSNALRALDGLIATADPSSGLTYFRY